MSAFYQKTEWLDRKLEVLDQPAFSERIHDRLRGKHFVDVLDAGTGCGNMFKVLSSLISFDSFRGFDIDADLIAEAQRRYHKKDQCRFEAANLYELPASVCDRQYDLITGMALLEHTEVRRALAVLKALLKPGGWLYLPHNYGSPTLFEPVFDPNVNQQMLENFDRYAIEGQIFEGQLSGDSRCGRKLPDLFQEQGLTVLDYQSSDWNLDTASGHPLHKQTALDIVDFFYEANRLEKIPAEKRLDPEQLEAWRVYYHLKIQRGEVKIRVAQWSVLGEIGGLEL